MKEVWSNEWFKLGAVVVVWLTSSVNILWGFTIVFAYLLGMLWYKQLMKQL